MEIEIVMPTQAGQICRLLNPTPDENPRDVYLITEDPSVFNDKDNIYVVNLKDIQRNSKNPLLSPQIAIEKRELSVIAENLEAYIKTWNT